MKILNTISSVFTRFRKSIVYAVVFLVVLTSVYWLRHMEKVLTEQSEWCMAQEEAYPLNVCGGIAERDIQRTYYLKVIMLSVLAFGSTALFLVVSEKDRS